jgi:hypothetical protein
MIFWYRIASRRRKAMEGKNDKILSEAAPIEPPRSRLYGLVPEGIDTPFIESLTSYINRLARSYCVSPRILVAQEIIPMAGGRTSSLPATAVDDPGCDRLFTTRATTGKALSPLSTGTICHPRQYTTRLLYPVHKLVRNIVKLRS